MAKQTRHLIDLSDITAAVLECNDCGLSMSFPLSGSRQVPETCPSCGVDWNQTNSQNTYGDSVVDFMTNLRGLKDAFEGPQGSPVKYAVSLEIDITEPAQQQTSSKHS